MIFETFDDKRNNIDKFISNSGDPCLEIYEYRYDEKGVKELVKTDRKEDVFARIQADADSCDINKLMARFALGDESAINKRNGIYIDASEFPRTYAEMFDRVEECKRIFSELPTDLKQSFDNSYEVFFASMGTKDFDEKFEKYNDKFRSIEFDDAGNSQEDIKKSSDVSSFTEVER